MFVLLIAAFICRGEYSYAIKDIVSSSGTDRIEWEPVEGSTGYVVEIETPDGQHVESGRIMENYLKHDLSEGKYKVRIGVFNKFDRIEVYSEWFDLNILKALKPEVTEMSVRESYLNESIEGITVRGNNLVSGARLFLRQGDIIIPAQNCIFNGNESVTFDISTRDVLPGYYDLVIENPGGLSSTTDGVFQVTLKKELPPLFSVAGGMDAGYFFTQVIGPWGGRYDNSFLGAGVLLYYPLSGVRGWNGMPFIRDMRFELEFDYIAFSSIKKDGVVNTDLSHFDAGGNISMVRMFPAWFGIGLRLGGGYNYSSVQEHRIYSTSSSYGSGNAFVRTGLSLLFIPYNNISVQLRTDYCPVFYSGHVFHSIRYGLFAGIGF